MSQPILVYTKQNSLIISQINLDMLRPSELHMTSTVLKEDALEARAVAAHHNKGLVFYSDINTDVVYSTDTAGSIWREITANTRRVEGMTS